MFNEAKESINDIIDGEYSDPTDVEYDNDSDEKKVINLIKKNKIKEPVAIFDYTVDVSDMKKVAKILKKRKSPFFELTLSDDESSEMMVFSETDL